MKQKINILINNEALRLGLYYGFWNWFFIYKKELLDCGIQVNFFSKLSNQFFDADHLFLNSRSIPSKKDRIDLEYLEKIYLRNKNLYWFDMRDSAGTTQFEVLHLVKKYIKKNFYKDKKVYLKKLKGGRYYTDYYIEKYNIKDYKEYDQEILKTEYLPKLILGWNLGVGLFFDYISFSKIDYYLELIKFKFFNSEDYKMKLPQYQNWSFDNKKSDFVSLMNTNFKRESVGYQRMRLKEILRSINSKNRIIEGRFSKKNYYKALRNSKVSIGAYGWGEVCYREFEAINCGAAILFPDMSNIETWPNIYINNETYVAYNLDFRDIHDKIENLVSDINLRKRLVNNSQKILSGMHQKIGKDYFLNKIKEIID